MKSLAWPSRMAGQNEPDGSQRVEALALASFAGAKRRQGALLAEAEVTAGLRDVVTGVTCLAWPRSEAPRLTLAPIVLLREDEPVAPPLRRRCMRLVEGEEGGIYSW